MEAVTVAPAWGGGHGLPRHETPPSLGCKISDLAPAIVKYCWSSKTSCTSPQQHAGPSETAINGIEPIVMGAYREDSLLLSFACVKWLSDQICRNYCKFGRSATITLRTRKITEGYYLSVWRTSEKMRPYRSVHNNRYRSETRRANPGGCVCVNVTTWERNHVILPVAISPFCLRYVLRETKYGIGVLCENTVNTSVCVSYCPYIERGVQTFSGPKPERERSATALPKQPAQPRLAQLENFKIYFYYNNIIS